MISPGDWLRDCLSPGDSRYNSAMGFSKRMMAQERAAALRAEAERLRRLCGPEIAEAEELIRRWNRRLARGWPLGIPRSALPCWPRRHCWILFVRPAKSS